jgi:signal transduction histidine kinase
VLPSIVGDPSQLVQLIVNLIRNAIESMPNGGTVVIRASERAASGTVIIEVIDEGIGVDPTLRSKIFEPFFTTKPLGTGLGLSICREIADFHRARLTLLPRGKSSGTIARVEFSQPPLDTSDKVSIEALIVSRQQSLRETRA